MHFFCTPVAAAILSGVMLAFVASACTSSSGTTETCGQTATQLDSSRSCEIGQAPATGACVQQTSVPTKSSVMVCAVSPTGDMFVFYTASNWSVSGKDGWVVARANPGMGTTNDGLGPSDLAACNTLIGEYGVRSQAVPACGTNDAGTDAH
jgi:tripartite-type tricarboxylate transporter receptor subunit TctC